MAELFGFNITRVKPQTDPKQQFSQPQAEDGTQVVAAGGFFGSYLDMEGTAKTEQDLIRRYREIALHPECDMAIEDIVNEAITSNENKQAVKVITDGLEYSSAIKQKIETEFAEVLRLLQFNTRGHDLFRRWYVDGRIFFQNQEMTFDQIDKLRTKTNIGIRAYPRTSYNDFMKAVRYAKRTGRRVGTNIKFIPIKESESNNSRTNGSN